ncbi:hypothetical protein [Deinococcus koreensis]|uniref:Uncharacterized protein n=1 Tax=Deinococcus koreensis TaxID=2054903 RepID=A0A2K3V0E3_9DEIO|nr:hypothetical protein [Deinococcus koreensis]PNY82245.1 hypothetical protein CVO96_13545 [Deinococcus koreensis]
MATTIQLHPEFLRRLLGEGGDDVGVQVLPDALPDDLPLTLPELAGTRIWGSTTGTATRWTFVYPGSAQPPTPRPLRQWYVLLDVPGTASGVMGVYRSVLGEQGWQSGTMFEPVFVEAGHQQWMGVHPEASRTLSLTLRQVGDVSQLGLRVQDIGREELGHWLGQPGQPGQPHFDHFQRVPMPTLAAPMGWRVQPQGGNGGTERSENALLVPGEGTATDLEVLLVDFAAHLASQGWEEIEQQATPDHVRLLARTAQGYGFLGLNRLDGVVEAKIVHVALNGGLPGSHLSFNVISS